MICDNCDASAERTLRNACKRGVLKNTDIKKEIYLHVFHRLRLRERVTNHKSQLAETASGRQHPHGPKTGLREEERPASEKQAYGSRSQKKSKKSAKHLCIRQIIRTFASAFAQSLSGKTERSLVCCVVTITFLINKTMDLIKIAEEAFATGKQHPSFKAGDTVTVAYRIVEGNKERVQLYRGVVIKISGHGEKKRFTVRKMSSTVGVERIFPIESPAIDSIEVNKIGKVRRAKLYYLRNLTGKKARIKEKRANA